MRPKTTDRSVPRSTRSASTGRSPEPRPEAADAATIEPLLRKELDEVVAGICKALNDAKRLLILHALRQGRYTVSELCEIIDVPQSNASQHLAVLRDRGLVEAERRGNTVVYSLRHPKIMAGIGLLRKDMSDELRRQTAPPPSVR